MKNPVIIMLMFISGLLILSGALDTYFRTDLERLRLELQIKRLENSKCAAAAPSDVINKENFK